MNVLLVYFDSSVNQSSPLEEDTVRVVKKDEKGNEFVIYEPFDSMSYQKSLGLVQDWSLNSLVAAGIDPRFGVQTTFNSRLEGISQIEKFDAVLRSDFVTNSVDSKVD